LVVNNTLDPQYHEISGYLNKGIKEIITEHPEIEAILDDYEIGCGPCMVGTCLLKDIVDVHSLPPEEEMELMARITKAIYPDKEVMDVEVKRKAKATKTFRYSPPVKRLVDEHILIKRLVALIPQLIDDLDLGTEEGRKLILDSVDFIRTYADKYHHAKEEELLFKYFDEEAEIIKSFMEDHRNARNHVMNIISGVEEQDREKVLMHLDSYRELLSGHIKREDEILYPWMDKCISTTQVGELFSSFNEVDEVFGDAPERYEEFIVELEELFKNIGE
jgi:hemerythrin-like domain-containing protein